jgi:ABC-2 type transport system ATP-binding protein
MTEDIRDPQPVAELRGIHKRYGTVEALRGVILQLHAGELVALLGPNGAGKTTAVSILGQRRPDAGSARLFGRDPTLPAARRLIGVTLQESGLPRQPHGPRGGRPDPRPLRRPATNAGAP